MQILKTMLHIDNDSRYKKDSIKSIIFDDISEQQASQVAQKEYEKHQKKINNEGSLSRIPVGSEGQHGPQPGTPFQGVQRNPTTNESLKTIFPTTKTSLRHNKSFEALQLLTNKIIYNDTFEKKVLPYHGITRENSETNITDIELPVIILPPYHNNVVSVLYTSMTKDLSTDNLGFTTLHSSAPPKVVQGCIPLHGIPTVKPTEIGETSILNTEKKYKPVPPSDSVTEQITDSKIPSAKMSNIRRLTILNDTMPSIKTPELSLEERNKVLLESLQNAIFELQDHSVTIFDEIKKISYVINGLTKKIIQLHALVEHFNDDYNQNNEIIRH